ncbi:MAG: TonB family protein [Bacteroidota bacterium]
MQREFIFTDKWSDLVFENRNQSYGAYMLRKRLPGNILIGYLTALLLMGTIVYTGYQFSKISIVDLKGIIDQLPTSIIYEVPPLQLPHADEKKPVQKNPSSKPSTGNFIPVIKDSAAASDTNEKIEKSDEPVSKDTAGIEKNYNENPENGTGSNLSSESKEPFMPYTVEKLPEFPGGESAMIKFIQRNTHVPDEFLKNEISKTVYISFVVDSSGKVYGIKSLNAEHQYSGFSAEAMRAISKMPPWIPGQQNGTNVSVRMVLPVRFSVK